jgi:hypothetical protein
MVRGDGCAALSVVATHLLERHPSFKIGGQADPKVIEPGSLGQSNCSESSSAFHAENCLVYPHRMQYV